MYKTILDTVYYKEEIRQLYTRIIFLVLVTGFYLYQNIIDNPLLKMHSMQVTILIYLAFGVTFFHTLFIYIYPKTLIFFRRQIIMAFDFIATTLLLYCFETHGVYFAPLYLWIIIGNGIRYGIYYIFAGINMALLALGTLVYFSEYWFLHNNVILALAIAVIILPLFYVKLLNRLKKKNQVLKEVMKRMEYQARYDVMTDIFNRQSFESEIKKSIDDKRPFALFFIDLDDFKKINDNYGHYVGDIVLKQVADRLKKLAEKKHFVARLGGDEFVMIKYDPKNDLKETSKSISQTISGTYIIENLMLDVHASIGISLYPKNATDIIELMRYADIAMYEAKKNDKSKFMFYH